MENNNSNRSTEIQWDLPGHAIEAASFATIEAEVGSHSFDEREWPVARRLIHTTGDFSIIESLKLRNRPVESGRAALRRGAPIYCDANMIRSGLSIPRLKALHDEYERESIHCYIAHSDVAAEAKERGITRALCSMEKAKPLLDGGIILIGNAPLALARLCRFIKEDGIKPALVIGIPVGFVNVVESKNLLGELDVPHITVEGRRGGSPLAVAALHAITESPELAY